MRGEAARSAVAHRAGLKPAPTAPRTMQGPAFRISSFEFPLLHMPRCVSFVHSRRHAAAWSRCARRTRRGDILCPHHRDAIDGVVMGALHATKPVHVNQAQIVAGQLEDYAQEFADASARAWLGIPDLIPNFWRSKKERREEREARGQASAQFAATAPASARLPPQACADG